MKRCELHPQALEELLDQVQFYEERSEGLGSRFFEQIETAINLAASMPAIGSPYKRGTRRVFPKDFPCSIIFRESSEQLLVVAVAAFTRKPGYWHGR